jgi:hypothetical protein
MQKRHLKIFQGEQGEKEIFFSRRENREKEGLIFLCHSEE